MIKNTVEQPALCEDATSEDITVPKKFDKLKNFMRYKVRVMVEVKEAYEFVLWVFSHISIF